MIAALRRALALRRIRSLEIQLDGMNESMQIVECPQTRLAISQARINLRRDLTQARATYLALFPPGVRRTWSTA